MKKIAVHTSVASGLDFHQVLVISHWLHYHEPLFSSMLASSVTHEISMRIFGYKWSSLYSVWMVWPVKIPLCWKHGDWACWMPSNPKIPLRKYGIFFFSMIDHEACQRSPCFLSAECRRSQACNSGTFDSLEMCPFPSANDHLCPQIKPSGNL